MTAMTQPHPDKPGRQYDAVIVGGGMVGASLAVALAPCGLALAVVEPAAADSGQQPSFDERTVALTDNARRIYTGMGIWRRMAPHAQPIREIHISDRGHFGMTHLSCADVGAEALGYVLPTRVIGRVLHREIRQSSGVALYCPATVENLQQRRRNIGVRLSQNAKTTMLSARLVVLADGGRSHLAGQIGITSDAGGYPQSAIIAMVATDRAHHGRAFERFTAEGPLALLPYLDNRYVVVWTTAAERVAARMALPDGAFVDDLQRVFGDRAGNFSDPGARKCYALQHSMTGNPAGRRAVAIGNAAHSVHPVAGQGFNLGLRDAAVLAEVLHRAMRQGRDIGGAEVLGEYAALRRREAMRVSGFTDGLIGVFCHRRKAVGLARNLALVGIELLPPAKRFLLRRTMGMSGAGSRLGAGLALV